MANGVCDRFCNGCVFKQHINGGKLMLCEYYFRTGRRRPCPAGSGCTVKETGKRKFGWALENDATWENKQKWKVKYHRECLYCGKGFDTSDGRKAYCCFECRNKNKWKKQRANSPVYHRACKECGAEFYTTDPRKIFCCRDHALKYKQRERYRMEKKHGEETKSTT